MELSLLDESEEDVELDESREELLLKLSLESSTACFFFPPFAFLASRRARRFSFLIFFLAFHFRHRRSSLAFCFSHNFSALLTFKMMRQIFNT